MKTLLEYTGKERLFSDKTATPFRLFEHETTLLEDGTTIHSVRGSNSWLLGLALAGLLGTAVGLTQYGVISPADTSMGILMAMWMCLIGTVLHEFTHAVHYWMVGVPTEQVVMRLGMETGNSSAISASKQLWVLIAPVIYLVILPLILAGNMEKLPMAMGIIVGAIANLVAFVPDLTACGFILRFWSGSKISTFQHDGLRLCITSKE